MRHIPLLLKKQFYEDRKGLIIYAAVILCVMIIPNLIAGFIGQLGLNSFSEDYRSLFGNFLYIGGFIMVSMAFSEGMYSKVKQHAWLMTPAHAHEKLIAKELSYAAIYPLALMLFMFISSTIVAGLDRLFFGVTHEIFNLADPAVWKMVLYYLVGQSIFILGATYFKKAHFIKTVLAILLFLVVFGLLAMLFARIIYAPYAKVMFHGNINLSFNETTLMLSDRLQNLFNFLEVTGKVFFWALLAPFCLIVSYFRIREVEAKDAV